MLLCNFAFSSETSREIKRRFGLSDVNIDLIRSELSRLQGKATTAVSFTSQPTTALALRMKAQFAPLSETGDSQ